MRRTPMIQLDSVTIQYGPIRAVDTVSLDVEAGEIFGLLGPNGSGKSSTLAAIAGILRPVSGRIRIQQHCIRDKAEVCARQIGFVPQEIALYEELSVWENLRFFGELYGLSGRFLHQRMEISLHTVQMMPRAQQSVGTLSGGLQRRVNLACALLHDPAVLLLDEPCVALDPCSREVLFNTLSSLRQQGKAIILTTHHLEDAEQWCDRVGVLLQGKLIALDRPARLFHEIPHKTVVLGQLRLHLAEQLEQIARSRLGKDIAFEVWGKQIRIEAPSQELMGRALATLCTTGIELESFRTPPARLDRILEESAAAATEPAILPFPTEKGEAWAA
ncbi:ABC transporter ATP-binding protein [Telmatocola sphagniphila]|uniref:ABC transporter ATP-binding protein n=1 Tax=Telmatocola sphagniphila TaxID=1123043 RepID=A0A8E6B3L3_9BACT|nr:ABC transporter ATP-binding protein [Telmatocola sphagniphila]QVL31096.1 ABC transporter ATP-binding protein [Telmatocola sphagniphila]